MGKIEGRCPKCNKEELIYWIKDETERTIEAYMNCKNCNREFSKIPISKEQDTSDKAVRKKLKQRHNVKEVREDGN